MSTRGSSQGAVSHASASVSVSNILESWREEALEGEDLKNEFVSVIGLDFLEQIRSRPELVRQLYRYVTSKGVTVRSGRGITYYRALHDLIVDAAPAVRDAASQDQARTHEGNHAAMPSVPLGSNVPSFSVQQPMLDAARTEQRARVEIVKMLKGKELGELEGDVAFPWWKDQVISAQELFGATDADMSKALPFITKGMAHDTVKKIKGFRFQSVMAELERIFLSSTRVNSVSSELSTISFDRYSRKNSDRVSALREMVSDIQISLRSVGNADINEIGRVALTGLMNSSYAPQMALSLSGCPGAEVQSRAKVFLSAMDKRDESNGRRSQMFATFPNNDQAEVRSDTVRNVNLHGQPRRAAINTAARCRRCLRRGHYAESCMARYPTRDRNKQSGTRTYAALMDTGAEEMLEEEPKNSSIVGESDEDMCSTDNSNPIEH